MTIFEFMKGSPVLTFLIACLVTSTVARFIRFLGIVIRGWPPSHLDADGDFEERF